MIEADQEAFAIKGSCCNFEIFKRRSNNSSREDQCPKLRKLKAASTSCWSGCKRYLT